MSFESKRHPSGKEWKTFLSWSTSCSKTWIKNLAPTTEISKEAITAFASIHWPGNVRELENALHSASVVSKGKRILTKDLPSLHSGSADEPLPLNLEFSKIKPKPFSLKSEERSPSNEIADASPQSKRQKPFPITFGKIRK